MKLPQSLQPKGTPIIGSTPAILRELAKAQKYAQCDAAVLIHGETGTGKEVFARAVHDSGSRSSRSFVPFNCANTPLELFENELFGHESGAFTGARGASQGLLGKAQGGTLFLDEIECLPLLIQAKFLRFLQDGYYRPLGSANDEYADVRTIAASNRDLFEMTRRGEFRQDLLFRLNVLPLWLPPLRERREDIPELVAHLLQKHATRLHRLPPQLSPRALKKLIAYSWPGNVRELENVIQRILVLNSGELIEEISIDGAEENGRPPLESFRVEKARRIREFEREYLQDVLGRTAGNISQAARLARKPRRSFFELLRKYGIAGKPKLPTRDGNSNLPSPDLIAAVSQSRFARPSSGADGLQST